MHWATVRRGCSPPQPAGQVLTEVASIRAKLPGCAGSCKGWQRRGGRRAQDERRRPALPDVARVARAAARHIRGQRPVLVGRQASHQRGRLRAARAGGLCGTAGSGPCRTARLPLLRSRGARHCAAARRPGQAASLGSAREHATRAGRHQAADQWAVPGARRCSRAASRTPLVQDSRRMRRRCPPCASGALWARHMGRARHAWSPRWACALPGPGAPARPWPGRPGRPA